METFISSVETSVQPPCTHAKSENSARNTPHYEPHGLFPHEKEITALQKSISEKDAHIEQLTRENEFLYLELERLRAQGEDEIKKSDALIGQMQTASEESSKRAHVIIMNLSNQVEKQAEHIEVLQDKQGFGGVVRKLKSKLPFLRFESTKQDHQSAASANAQITLEKGMGEN